MPPALFVLSHSYRVEKIRSAYELSDLSTIQNFSFQYFWTYSRRFLSYNCKAMTIVAKSFRKLFFLALVYIYICISFLCSGGKIIWFRPTKGSRMTLLPPTTVLFLVGHYLLIRWSCLALLSYRHKKQGYFA